MCWLKSEVKPAVENQCCVSGIKGAGLVEKKSGPVEMSIDRTGGDYRHFDLPSDPDRRILQEGLRGREPLPRLDLRAARLSRANVARCYLKDKITQPRRKPCCMSGVVR